MEATTLAAIATVIGAVLLFLGGLIGTWTSAKNNRLQNANHIKSLQIQMIDQLQEERNHTEQLLREERELRAKEIRGINERFEKYKEAAKADKAIDREYIQILKDHIDRELPPPPPLPPPGYKP